MLEGALIGAIVGLVAFFFMNASKSRRYHAIQKNIGPVDYSGLFHMANSGRFGKGLKFFDSYGALYANGNKLHYRTTPDASPIEFDLSTSTLQREQDWKKLKWFSVTTAVGEKYYFTSFKPGAFKNNSDETLRAFDVLKPKAHPGLPEGKET